MADIENTPRVSVLVCTYNRASQLRRVLRSLADQTLPKHLYEIVVIDNGSRDETADIVRIFQGEETGCTTIAVYEPKQGLGYARNTGLRHARGQLAAFIDDDAVAESDWLQATIACFDSVSPTPLCVGGPIFPMYESPRPAWFRDEYETRSWGDSPRFLNSGEDFSGSNMIVERALVDSMGGFSVRVGMRGDALSLGEETLFFKRLWQRGLGERALYYCPTAVVYHSVPAGRMTVRYRLKRGFAGGQSWCIEYGPTERHERAQVTLAICLSVVKLSASVVLFAWRYRHYQTWLAETLYPLAIATGRLLGVLGLFIPVKQR